MLNVKGFGEFTKVRREAPLRQVDQAGAGRDLAVLFIDICRVVGLAARFVSGYQEGHVDQGRRYMHAWAEVYLPGAGWRGFDPTHGLAAADRHIAVAAAAEPLHPTPELATDCGNNVEAELFADVMIETSSEVEVVTC